MTDRTTLTTIVFRSAFRIPGVGYALPAGSYEIETIEEPIPDLSFLAFRRVQIAITVAENFGSGTVRRSVIVRPADLDAAVELDARTLP